MARYAPYEPATSEQPRIPVIVRPAQLRDAEGIARLVDVWNDAADPRGVERAEREIRALVPAEPNQLFVALDRRDGSLVGYARCGTRVPARAPTGFYLLGTIVHPEARRRGVGGMLMAHRLAWAYGLGYGAVYSFISAQNRASERLHTTFGFEELTRDFAMERVTFEGGEGVLFVHHPRTFA